MTRAGSSLIAVAGATLAVSACATTKAVATCAPITSEQEMVASGAAMEAAFGLVRQGYYRTLDATAQDAAGNRVMTFSRIGPASQEQPAVGQGEGMTVVLERCTGRLIHAFVP